MKFAPTLARSFSRIYLAYLGWAMLLARLGWGVWFAWTRTLAGIALSLTAVQLLFPGMVSDTQVMELVRQYDLPVNVASAPAIPATLQSPPDTPWRFVSSFLALGLGSAFVISKRKWNKKQPARTWASAPEGISVFDDFVVRPEIKTGLMKAVQTLKVPTSGDESIQHIVLAGPAGCGKTSLVYAAAQRFDLPVFQINAWDLVEMGWKSAKFRLEETLKLAQQASPAILLIDDLHALDRVSPEADPAWSEADAPWLELLWPEMERLEPPSILIVATTQRLERLGQAWFLPGRFERVHRIGLPDYSQRLEILSLYTQTLPLNRDVSLHSLAGATTGLSGAALRRTCLLAGERTPDSIGMVDFQAALEQYLHENPDNALLDDTERWRQAYRVAGTALQRWLDSARALEGIDLFERDQALRSPNAHKGDLLYSLDSLLAGQAAVELGYGERGWTDEVVQAQATWLAHWIVSVWGQNHNLDMLEERIIEEGRRLVEERSQRVRSHLAAEQERLNRLANALYQEERLDKEMVLRLLHIKPGLTSALAVDEYSAGVSLGTLKSYEPIGSLQ